MLALAVALTLIGGVVGQDADQTRRAKVIEALQTAGINAATTMMCTMAGYEPDDDKRSAYIAREVEFAQSAGISEELAYSYAMNGLKGQSAADQSQMKRLTQLVEAGDPSGKAGMAALIDEVVERCDLLVSRSETSDLFSYAPLNALVAKRLAMKNMGLAK